MHTHLKYAVYFHILEIHNEKKTTRNIYERFDDYFDHENLGHKTSHELVVRVCVLTNTNTRQGKASRDETRQDESRECIKAFLYFPTIPFFL